MNNEERFKESLQKLVESKEFTFDEGNWEKAAQMMPSAGSPRNRVILYAVPLLILLLSGLFAYYYIDIAGTPAPVKAVAQTAPSAVPANPPVMEPSSLPSAEIVANAANLPQEPAEKPKSDLSAGSFLRSSENVSTSSSPSEKAATAQPEKAAVREAASHPATLRTKSTPAVVKTTQEKEQAPVQHTMPEVATTGPVATTAETPAKQQPDITSKKQEAPATPETSAPAKNAPVKSEAVKQSEKASSEPVAAPEPVVAAEPTPKPEITTATVATQPEAPVEAPAVASTTPAAQTPPVAKADSATTASNSLNPLPARKKLVMNFEVGADYLLGWKNPGTTDAAGFNPVVGFNYYNYLTDKLAVSFGAQYTTVSNLSYYSHVSKTTYFDLGVQNAVTVITPQKLHYLSVPLKVNYFINDNNAFGAGCIVSYLLTSDAKVETYDEILGQKTNRKTYNASGYNEGFNVFNTQLSVFYTRRIYRNFSVNAELMYGLTDVKNNGFFNSNVTERNSGFKLTLMYNLFR